MNRRKIILNGSAAALGAKMTAWPSSAEATESPQLKGYLRTNWSQDPFSFGSYSHIAKGASRADYRRLAAPIFDRLYFAGEAANPDRNSSVHAALESGRSVAANLLKQSNHKRIGIIGAGISGMVAAHTLSKAGRDVQVIEARDRIGGRIHSDTSLGVPCDLGASWLHGDKGNPLTPLTDQAKMRKVESKEDLWIARSGGKQLKEKELPKWLEEIFLYNNHAGTGAGSLNTLAYLFYSDYKGKEILFPDGYAQIFDQLKGDFEIKLSQIVSSVNYDKNGVQIVTDSEKFDFDAVIITVPLGVLKSGNITFSPALPKEKQQAINKLGMGTLDKVYLQFDEVFWDKDPHLLITPTTDFDPGYFNSWVNLYALFKEPILVVFNGGPVALELAKESDETVVNGALKTILSAYGK